MHDLSINIAFLYFYIKNCFKLTSIKRGQVLDKEGHDSEHHDSKIQIFFVSCILRF